MMTFDVKSSMTVTLGVLVAREQILVQTLGPDSKTKHSIGDRKQLDDELIQVRRAMYAILELITMHY